LTLTDEPLQSDINLIWSQVASMPRRFVWFFLYILKWTNMVALPTFEIMSGACYVTGSLLFVEIFYVFSDW